MEIISLNGLILMIAVCIIAFLIGYLVNGGRKDNKRLEKELEESREELKNYRSEVTSHFQETAHRINALTENYRNVYEHLARGAQDLCDTNDAPELMNEMNRNPMLSGQTTESPVVDHEVIPADAESDARPKKTDENPDNPANAVADTVTDQGSNTVESHEETDEHTGEGANSDEHNNDEPIVAADEHTESDQQSTKEETIT